MKPLCWTHPGIAARTLVRLLLHTHRTSSKPALAALCFPFLLCTCPLLGLEWIDCPGGRRAALPVPNHGKAGFHLMPASETGIQFTNHVHLERHITNQIFLSGSGVALGDLDGDDLCDIFFAGLDQGGRLFKNLGEWKFRDITESAFDHISLPDSTGVALADVDGNSDLDLLFNTIGHGTHVCFNDGHAHFTESPRNANLNPRMGGMSLALADIDGDTDLDLYVANYRTVTIRDQPNTRFRFRMLNGKATVASVDGRPITDPDLAHRFNFHINLENGKGTFAHDENGEPDALFLNDGKGHFSPVSFTDGRFLDEAGLPLAQPPFDWGLSVAFRDLNDDGAPDLYVCNDFKSPDRIWLNDGKGRFRAAPSLAFRQTSLSSMGVDFADINRDGLDDIFVVDMLSREHIRRFTQRFDFQLASFAPGQFVNRPQYPRNTLFLSRGDGTYAEIAQAAGIDATEWSWTPIFLDVDLDGYEDLLVSTGFERDNLDADTLTRIDAARRARNLFTHEQLQLRKMFPRLNTPNLAFRNLGDCRFADASAEWGFNAPGVSQGMALGDLDNDGDLDVVLSNMNEPPLLYRNETAAPRIIVSLKGLAANSRGVGARIQLRTDPMTQHQQIQVGGRYLSSDNPQRVFAVLGSLMILDVRWPSGQTATVSNLLPNHAYEVREGPDKAVPRPAF